MVTYVADWRYLKNEKSKDYDDRKHKIGIFVGYFFGSKKIEFVSGAEYNLFMEKARNESSLLQFPSVTFSDGSIIEHISGGSAKGDNPIDWYIGLGVP